MWKRFFFENEKVLVTSPKPELVPELSWKWICRPYHNIVSSLTPFVHLQDNRTTGQPDNRITGQPDKWKKAHSVFRVLSDQNCDPLLVLQLKYFQDTACLCCGPRLLGLAPVGSVTWSRTSARCWWSSSASMASSSSSPWSRRSSTGRPRSRTAKRGSGECLELPRELRMLIRG